MGRTLHAHTPTHWKSQMLKLFPAEIYRAICKHQIKVYSEHHVILDCFCCDTLSSQYFTSTTFAILWNCNKIPQRTLLLKIRYKPFKHKIKYTLHGAMDTPFECFLYVCTHLTFVGFICLLDYFYKESYEAATLLWYKCNRHNITEICETSFSV